MGPLRSLAHASPQVVTGGRDGGHAVPRASEREREQTEWQRERRGKRKSRGGGVIDRWFVNLRGFDRNLPPSPLVFRTS